MSRRSWILLGLLASLWGASYLFIKLALEDLSPAMVVFARTALAALVMLPVAIGRDALRGLRSRLTAVGVLASIQIAAPFMLISIGEQEISSSLTGILVASAPIFTALLAIWVDHEERSHGLSLVGIAIGIAGVVLLLGLDVGGSGAALVGGLLVVLAALGYAVGGFYLKRRLADLQPVGVVTAAMVASAALVAPFAIVSAPSAVPGLQASASIVALGVLGTGVAFVIFYTLIGTVGPAKASLVAYVAPGFAVIYGVTLLDERFTGATLAGLALILAGSWLAAEGRLPRRRPGISSKRSPMVDRHSALPGPSKEAA
jgi:drug/metabolite transporter (DMT)-like permease